LSGPWWEKRIPKVAITKSSPIHLVVMHLIRFSLCWIKYSIRCDWAECEEMIGRGLWFVHCWVPTSLALKTNSVGSLLTDFSRFSTLILAISFTDFIWESSGRYAIANCGRSEWCCTKCQAHLRGNSFRNVSDTKKPSYSAEIEQSSWKHVQIRSITSTSWSILGSRGCPMGIRKSRISLEIIHWAILRDGDKE
jgi:hypothetical protein